MSGVLRPDVHAGPSRGGQRRRHRHRPGGALDLAAGGARVVICGRRAGPLEAVRDEIVKAGGQCLALTADIREDVTSVVDAAMAEYGRVDILVNNAGGQFAAPAEQISPAAGGPCTGWPWTPRGR